jgi:hypothetical protein
MKKENGELEYWSAGVLQKCGPHHSITPSLYFPAV